MNITIWNSSGYLSFRQVWIGINYSRSEPRWPKCTAIPVQQGTCDFSAISFCKELDKNGEYMAQHGRKHFGGFICERVCLI